MSDVGLTPDGNIAVCRGVVAVQDAVWRVAGMMTVASDTSGSVMATRNVARIPSGLLPLLHLQIELWIVPRVKLRRLRPGPLVWCRLSIAPRLRIIIAVVACTMSQRRCVGPLSIWLCASRSLDELALA